MSLVKEIFTSEKYWQSVLKFGFIFIVVWSIVEHVAAFKGVNFEAFMELNINNGKWFRYLWSRLVGGLIYGLVASFVFQRRKIIESRK